MKNNKWMLTTACLVLGVMAILSATIPTRVIDGLPSTKGEVSQSELNKIKIDKNFGKMPLYFIPNEGQLDKRVFYYVQGKDKTIYFTSEGVTFSLSEQSKRKTDSRDKHKPLEQFQNIPQSGKRWTVQLEFIGARKDVKPVSLEDTGTVISYFKGKESEWKTGISTASKIMYRDLWPGIDLIYYGTVNQMKYEFVVHPGADPNRIKLAYHGAGDVRENPKGQLEVKTPAGNFHDDKPVAWQDIAGKRVSVSLKYALQTENKSADSYIYGFSVGKYDKNQSLILDPVVIVYCGYIGGSGSDEGHGIAVDKWGCVYVTGYTDSSEFAFPVKVGPNLTYSGGSYDAFVAKIKSDGTGLVYCGYIGGSDYDVGNSISVDASGCAYVVGYTGSTEATFPVKVGPDLTHNGKYDTFVAKIKADGTGLVYCGYIGGNDNDYGNGIAVDAAGSAYVVGYTYSNSDTFPVAIGPDKTFNGGSRDAFAAKIKSDGTGLVYCGYIGGNINDYGRGIAVDAAGSAYVVGYTSSNESTFPLTIGPDVTSNGNSDAFVAKLKADGTGLVYCGYIGGSNYEEGRGIAVDIMGSAYVVGYTYSNEGTFPVQTGPDVTFHGGNYDAFVAKVKADGSGLVYCGYIGSYCEDAGNGIAVDAAGSAYVVGHTNYYLLPVTIGPDISYNGSVDAFVAKVKVDGSCLNYCGYIGGSNDDCCCGITIDASGNAYVTGYTLSSETNGFPLATGPILTYGGGTSDAFVAKVSMSYNIKFVDNTGGTVTGSTMQTIIQGNSSTPVTAVPNTGYRFVNWTGSGGFVTSTQNPLIVKNVSSDMLISANFTPNTIPGGWKLVDGLQYNMIAYGKAYNAKNLAAAGDWIGAFGPGGITDCRGTAFVGTNGNYYLTIGSNVTSGETISFKLWPLSVGPSIDGSETLTFTENGSNPGFTLHFGQTQQDIPLAKGWNWISFNVMPTNTSLNTVFGSAPSIFEQIKTQSKAAIYTNGSWVGNLTNMDDIANGTMYKIKVTQARTLSVKGLPILYEKPIPLISGWNWTAYLPAFSQSTELAINSIKTSVEQIKNQTQSLIKSGASFLGDLTQMEPNKGYMIKMNASGSLIYPYGSAPSLSKSAKSTLSLTPAIPWKVIKGNQFNMITHGNVYLNGKPVNGKDYYLIAVGPGGDYDCRSIRPVGKGGSFFATILGNTNGETIRFKLYNSTSASTLITGSSIVFKTDELTSGLVISF
ncbi:MAG: SBBP repeat-containing protein [Candidatus Omnitrophota bacterium]